MRAKATTNDGSLSIGDLFIEKCSPESQTFTITVNGIDIKCKVITDYMEILQLRRSASEFAEKSLKGFSGAMKDWSISDPEVAARAFMLHAVAIEPVVSQLDALKIAKKCGIAFELLLQAIDRVCSVDFSLKFDKEIEDQKKDS